jgi:hypothetical protein
MGPKMVTSAKATHNSHISVFFLHGSMPPKIAIFRVFLHGSMPPEIAIFICEMA